MSKFAVAIFSDEKKAYEGLRDLKELDREGMLTLYSNAVVARSADGLLAVKERQTEGALGTAVGALVGGLIGTFAGPAGVAAGLGGGSVLGAFRDLFNLGVSSEFIETIGKELAPGKAAVIAEISEEWVMPLDSRMQALGGVVIREWRDDFIDEELQRNIDKGKAELAQRRAELAAARADKAEAMKKAVSKAEGKLRAAADKANALIKHYRDETEAKIHALEDRAAKASADTKARIDARMAEIRADQKRRLGKLEQAWKLTQEALRP